MIVDVKWHSVGPWRHDTVMYIAQVVCSDPSCAVETIVEAATIEEIMSLVCECGCAIDVVGWPDWTETYFDNSPVLH